jgi:aminomethyltransferase
MPEPFHHPLRQSRAVSVGTAFYSRAAALNRKQQWREWSGYLAASAYDDSHELEYNAIREAAALIDVSPLYKYLVSGPDATRLVDRVITRDATKLAVGRVYYTSWCNEDGRVVDDGTVGRLDEQTFRWTAADPSLRWFRMNARDLDVEIEDVSERVAALAVQGPLSRDVLEAATGTAWGDLRYFGRRAAQVGDIAVDVSRTGYTGDLGYEVWVDRESAVEVWDAFARAGGAYGARAAGILALDITRVEAGLILIEVDFDSVRRALIPEQSFSPFELGILGRFVDFEKETDFVGRRALEREQERGGPQRRLVGLELDWEPLEELYRARGLTPTLDPAASRVPVPLYTRGRQVGKATSTTWSPILKKVVALASVDAKHSGLGTRIEVEWTVEARRSRVPATVVELPFFNPERKTSTVAD